MSVLQSSLKSYFSGFYHFIGYFWGTYRRPRGVGRVRTTFTSEGWWDTFWRNLDSRSLQSQHLHLTHESQLSGFLPLLGVVIWVPPGPLRGHWSEHFLWITSKGPWETVGKRISPFTYLQVSALIGLKIMILRFKPLFRGYLQGPHRGPKGLGGVSTSFESPQGVHEILFTKIQYLQISKTY